MKKEKTEFRDKKTAEKIIDVVRTSAIIIGVFAVLGIGLLLYLAWPKKTEMTQAEKKWLIKHYEEDEERINKGYLYGNQKGMLEKLRMGMTYLEEKYPGYEFYIHYIDDWAITVYECAVTEQKTGYTFDLMFYKNEDKSIDLADDFYSYFMEDKYDAYLEDVMREKIDRIAEINTYMPFPLGKEYDANMKVEDIVSGKLDVSPRGTFHISAIGMTEEDCVEYVSKMSEIIEEIDLPGMYTIMCWNMTEEELLTEERNNLILDCLIKKEEGKWKTKIY
ncbi:MAG: hypothetical protein IKY23_07395 [Lachnospiraceae bacterium]|nr:hypothetical protein [Lachnospiraceae bacterium]